ncbi:hypothetical protein ACMGDK_11510 [Chryseobacterium sp. DT-3]|uniref:hypothetical protein n=1 Tax=Chryseobacterium sp. DT-3 TaxID=3396164 RepID=UPI003F1D05F2
MEILVGLSIPTIYYYGNMLDEDGNAIDNKNEPYASSIFYSIDNIVPGSYNGYNNGTIMTSGGTEYFTYIDTISIHNKIQEVKKKEFNTLLFNQN